MSIRRRLVASGLVVLAVYVAAAAWSGNLSPLARRPLLDGTLPPTPYRWVDPPPALAAENEPPTPGTFRAELGADGTDTQVFTTDDAQVTLILSAGAFAPAPGERAVEITVTPRSSDEVSPVDRPLEIVGNVVRLDATYVPSGDPVPGIDGEVRVVLVYPFELNVHAGHTLVSSPDGTTWTTHETNDLPSIQQADAVIPGLGDVAVARRPGASPTPAPSSTNTVATVAIVAGLVVLVAIVGFLLFHRPASPTSTRPPIAPPTGTTSKEPVTAAQRKKRRRR